MKLSYFQNPWKVMIYLKPIIFIYFIPYYKPMVTIYVTLHYSFLQNPWRTYIKPMENYEFVLLM